MALSLGQDFLLPTFAPYPIEFRIWNWVIVAVRDEGAESRSFAV
jgi:hypothetical protein